MANGYQSSRTGNQTEQLLNRAAISLVPRNGALSSPGAEGTFASGTRGNLVIVNTVGDSTHTPDVVASSRLTEENVVISNAGFDATSSAGKILIVAQSGSNNIAVSDIPATSLIKAASTLATNNAVILGSTTTNGVKPSARMTDSNVVIANTAFSARNKILMGGGSSNVATDQADGLVSVEGEIYVDSNSRPTILNKNIDIGTIGTSGTLSGTPLSNLTAAVTAKNKKLMGSILTFSDGSNSHIAEVIHAVASGNNYMIGAIFNTYNNGGIQMKMLTINSTTGAYIVRTLVVEDTTAASFNIIPE